MENPELPIECENKAQITALSHHLILKRIFSCLDVPHLLQLSFVNKMWCSAARSTLRYKKRCLAGNRGENPCQELLLLNELLASSDDPPYSGLAIRTCVRKPKHGKHRDKKPPMMISDSEKDRSHSFQDTSDLTSEEPVLTKRYSDHKDCICAKVSDIYPALLGKLYYRHLEIHWEGKISCPAQSLLITILKERRETLEELKITGFPPRISSLKNGLRIDENLWLPKLQVVNLSDFQSCCPRPDSDGKPLGTLYQESLKHDIILAAPSLQRQLGYNRLNDLDFFLEQNRIPVIQHFYLTCADVFADEKDSLVKFIDANPKLTKVVIARSSRRPYFYNKKLRRFFALFMKSASGSLEELLLDEKHFLLLLSHVLTEPFVNLRCLNLELLRDRNNLRAFPTLEEFDWGSWFPSLKIVNIIGTISSNKNSVTVEELQGAFVSSAGTSVEEIYFTHRADCSLYEFETLHFFRNVFPNLSRISFDNIKSGMEIILKFIWVACPNAENVSLTSVEDFARNFDSVFCGITNNGADSYRSYGSKHLRKISLAPAEPSILLLQRLKIFRVEITDHPSWVRCDKYSQKERASFFATKVSGLLAFSRIKGLGVEIVRPVCSKKDCGYTLEHLRPFVKLVDGPKCAS